MNTNEGVWLSINDYSRYKDISISTTRRHIKNNILKYKEENGKYFIYVNSVDKLRSREESDSLSKTFEIEHLRQQLRLLQEENNELKMLVDIYEMKTKDQLVDKLEMPPELPQIL